MITKHDKTIKQCMIIVKINDLINVLPLTNSLEANEFIMIDQNLVVQGEMTEEEVVNIVKQQSENEYDNETNEPEQIVTDTEAIKSLEAAFKYVQQKKI